jgi:hypothetical protein
MIMNGKASKKSSLFRLCYAVEVDIRASSARIWSLLTNAPDFPRWNSTVARITGEIAPGGQLQIHVPIAPNRTFRPKVTQFEQNRRMVWRDGTAPIFNGVRIFELSLNSDGTTRFSMQETLTGLILPMVKSSLPNFGPVFERYALDLKNEAERTSR